mmetsp:Transcript_39459/g.58592  ORF Transcript_39459/g.58592 Transcript_39459/m.58592 type:complete len:80 (-) Transcript_39459:458-697(-)
MAFETLRLLLRGFYISPNAWRNEPDDDGRGLTMSDKKWCCCLEQLVENEAVTEAELEVLMNPAAQIDPVILTSETGIRA